VTPKTVLEVQGSMPVAGETLRLGTWKLAEGSVMRLVGAPAELIAKAFLGLEPAAQIRMVGAKAGTQEARTVSAIAFADFEPISSLKVLEHLALAVRIGPPRLGKVPLFRDVLDEVGLAAWANTPARELTSEGRLQLSLAMLLVRLLPVWVLALPPAFDPSPQVVVRIKEAIAAGVAVVMVTEAEALIGLASQTRRLELRPAQD